MNADSEKALNYAISEGIIDMEQMGHKNIETTRKYYYFSNKNNETKRSQIRNAFS